MNDRTVAVNVPGRDSVALLAMTFKPEAKRELFAFMDSRYKVIAEPHSDRYELYDLFEDSAELKDLFPAGEILKASLNEIVLTSIRDGEVRADPRALAEDEKMKLEALGYVQ